MSTERDLLAQAMTDALSESTDGTTLLSEDIDLGQADPSLRQTPKPGTKGELAADKKPMSHSVQYDLTNKQVVGYQHLDSGRERTFTLPLEKAKYDKAIKAVVFKHGATAAGAKVAHDLFLAYSRAKEKVIKESSDTTEVLAKKGSHTVSRMTRQDGTGYYMVDDKWKNDYPVYYKHSGDIGWDRPRQFPAHIVDWANEVIKKHAKGQPR